MPNATEMYATLTEIERNPHRWRQDEWIAGWVKPAATTWTECGTTFCYAGITGARHGWLPVPDCHGWATGYMHHPDNPDVLEYASDIAQRILGLDDEEADSLFHSGNDLAALRDEIENILNHH